MVKEAPARKAPPPSRQEHACPDVSPRPIDLWPRDALAGLTRALSAIRSASRCSREQSTPGGTGEQSVSIRVELHLRGTADSLSCADAPGDTTSRCIQCDVSFARPDILARHVRLYHGDDEEARSLDDRAGNEAPVPAPVPIAPAPATKRRSRTGRSNASTSVRADDAGSAESPDAQWQLPMPPTVDALPDPGSVSGSDSTFEELQATLLSFDNVTTAITSGSDPPTGPGASASDEIFLPWDFPRFDPSVSPPPPPSGVAPTKRPRIRSPAPSFGSLAASGSPFNDLSLQHIATSSDSPPLELEGQSSMPPLTSPPRRSQIGSDCSYDEQLFTLPPALPRIRADEIIGSRALRPRHLAIQVLDNADDDWTHEDYEDGTVANWLQGAIVRSKEPSMYPGIDQ